MKGCNENGQKNEKSTVRYNATTYFLGYTDTDQVHNVMKLWVIFRELPG